MSAGRDKHARTKKRKLQRHRAQGKRFLVHEGQKVRRKTQRLNQRELKSKEPK